LLASQECGEHKWQATDPGTPLAFDRIQHRVRIKTLQQDERYAESDTGQHGEKSTTVYHWGRHRGDLVTVQVPVLKRLGSVG